MPLTATTRECEHRPAERWRLPDRFILGVDSWRSRAHDLPANRSGESQTLVRPRTFPSEGPSELQVIEERIQESRWILSLEEDWDGEGGRVVVEETWQRATSYLRSQALVCLSRHDVVIPSPRISPGPEGSIDIHWQTDSYELLVNIPENPAVPATFYGDDYGKLSIKGTFDPTSEPAGHLALVSWLIRD